MRAARSSNLCLEPWGKPEGHGQTFPYAAIKSVDCNSLTARLTRNSSPRQLIRTEALCVSKCFWQTTQLADTFWKIVPTLDLGHQPLKTVRPNLSPRGFL
jgi:hypothetical protein